MNEKKDEISPQVKALKTTNLTPLIHMSGLMVPRLMDGALSILSEKQKAAFNKVMPVGGKKRIYTHLVDTPTPPIVIRLAQPLEITTLSVEEVKLQGLKGIRLTTGDVQLASQGKTIKLVWRLMGQLGTLLGLASLFMPFVRLGAVERNDMIDKMKVHFKPLLDFMPH
jgi:hypothetical protein